MVYTKARNFVFTKNNWENWDGYPNHEHKDIRYICWGEEAGPQRETPHLQGYVQFIHPKTKNQAKAILTHCYVAKQRANNNDDAREYTRKGNLNWFEHGDYNPGGRGRRSDLHEAAESILSTGHTRDVDPATYIRYHAGLEKLAMRHSQKRDWKTEVIVYWGKPGTGKSRQIRELVGLDACYKPGNPKWWDGYDGHEVVVINEFSWTRWVNHPDVGREQTLDIFDRYPCKVEIKGGTKELLARTIYVSTNENPNEEWPEAMLRRITRLHEVA